MGKVFLIFMIVNSDQTYDFMRYEPHSVVECQVNGRKMAESILERIPDVRRISFKCVEVKP